VKLRAALVLICIAALSAAGAHAAGTTHAVRIEGMKFVPERLEVAAGDTVVWTNMDFSAPQRHCKGRARRIRGPGSEQELAIHRTQERRDALHLPSAPGDERGAGG